jgi:hypothetical protein
MDAGGTLPSGDATTARSKNPLSRSDSSALEWYHAAALEPSGECMFATRWQHRIGVALCGLFVPSIASADVPAERLFADRILPILKSDAPSSCSACHFGGVSLQQYIRTDQAATFAGLRQAGLIDIDHPDDSKLLTFLARKPERPSAAIEQLRETEYAAFRDWIRAAVHDPALLAAQTDDRVGIELPVEVVRHARSDRVLASFVDNIWSETARCINCHSPERNRGQIARLGADAVDAISWFVPNDPAATLQRLEDDANIDLAHPEQSPVLTKPAGLVKHGGGPKFQPGDVAYRKFLAFLQDYAAIRRGTYQSATDLPPLPQQLALLTSQHLRVTEIPADIGKVAWKVDLFRWDAAANAWSSAPVGTVSGVVNPQQHQAQDMVHVFTTPTAPNLAELRRDPQLPPGPWLARVYVDRGDHHARDPRYELGAGDFAGEVEIRGGWAPGYRPPQIIRFPVAAGASR